MDEKALKERIQVFLIKSEANALSSGNEHGQGTNGICYIVIKLKGPSQNI